MNIDLKEVQMKRMFHILIVEDLPSDAYLIQREVKKALKSCSVVTVETMEEFVRSLSEFKPDIVLSDFSLPGFDWLSAFNLVREMNPEIPFIIVSGSTSKEIANQCLEKGVRDFISKKNIELLGPVIQKIVTGKIL
jgi:two-component system, cell cycle sensor histidine kinase and response regulator CckA